MTNTKHKSKVTKIKVTQSDLPLSCPRLGDALWNKHPQVYLPIEETQDEVCPYCGTHYVLVDK